jgi:hypothetical protein
MKNMNQMILTIKSFGVKHQGLIMEKYEKT